MMTEEDENFCPQESEEFNINMKCCVTKMSAVFTCSNCFSMYHKSCAKRFPNLKKTANPNVVICCNNNADVKLEKPDSLRSEYEKILLENKYLKLLLEEVQDKNKILNINNSFLLERIKSSEDKQIGPDKDSVGNFPYRNAVLKKPTRNCYKDSGSVKSATELYDHEDLSTDFSNLANVQPSSSKQGVLPIPSRQQAKAIIPRTDGPASSFVDNENASLVRRRFFRKNVGTAKVTDKESGFTGADKKVWIYICSVKRTATEELVLKYIKDKPGYEDIPVAVKELPSDPAYLKRFVVNAPFEKKDELYASEFWPQNVSIKRFNFRKHQDNISGSFL